MCTSTLFWTYMHGFNFKCIYIWNECQANMIGYDLNGIRIYIYISAGCIYVDSRI